MNNNDQWLSTEEAADQLGISRHSLLRLLEEEQIPVFHIGRNYRVSQKALNELKQRRLKPLDR